MKKILKVCLMVVLLGAGTVQSAETRSAEFRVGVVDKERILIESAPAINAGKKIEKEFSGREQDIKKLMQKAKELQSLLDKEGGKLSDIDRRNKDRELTALNVNLQRLQHEFSEDLNLRKNEELSLVLEQANKAIQVIAEAEQYDLVLQEAVYRNPKIDITDMVIKYLANDKAANDKTDGVKHSK